MWSIENAGELGLPGERVPPVKRSIEVRSTSFSERAANPVGYAWGSCNACVFSRELQKAPELAGR